MKRKIISIWLAAFTLVGCSQSDRSTESVTAQPRETIAVIGTGDMGDSLGPRFAQLGYKVTYGSRDPARDSVVELVRRTGHGASATTQREAVIDADIVVLAVPWPPMEQVAQNLGNLDGKIVIDISTPDRQAEDGYMESLVETSSGEMIQEWNPGARVVKTVLVSSIVIDDPTVLGGPISTHIAADNREAKEVVARLVHELGLIPLDAGPLRHAREIEGLVRLWYVPILQGRSQAWELGLRPNYYWPCIWQDDWSEPVGDKENLAQIPQPEIPRDACSSYLQQQ